MLLHFFQPHPQPISLALTQQMTKGLHLACRASQRLVGLDQPRPQDAERSCIFDGSTDAWLVQHSRLSTDKGSDIFSFSRGGVKVVGTFRKVPIRSIEPLSVFWQEKTAYSSRFHASCSRISSKGLLILWGHCSEHRNFNSLRHLTLFMVNG